VAMQGSLPIICGLLRAGRGVVAEGGATLDEPLEVLGQPAIPRQLGQDERVRISPTSIWTTQHTVVAHGKGIADGDEEASSGGMTCGMPTLPRRCYP